MIEISKNTFAGIGVICLAGMQMVAWGCGYNGQVFAFTSSLIAGLIGFVLGIGTKKLKSE